MGQVVLIRKSAVGQFVSVREYLVGQVVLLKGRTELVIMQQVTPSHWTLNPLCTSCTVLGET